MPHSLFFLGKRISLSRSPTFFLSFSSFARASATGGIFFPRPIDLSRVSFDIGYLSFRLVSSVHVSRIANEVVSGYVQFTSVPVLISILRFFFLFFFVCCSYDFFRYTQASNLVRLPDKTVYLM